MPKLFSFILCLLISVISIAQSPSKTPETSIDTAKELKLLEELLSDIDQPSSYFDASIGIGNKLFSVKNNTINASQAQVKKIYFTPSIAYHHKSGFSLSLTPYITSDSGAFKVYQTALTPSYEFSNSNLSFGISYTRYLADKSYNSNSIYQNDLYAYFKYTKPYIQPILSVGFAGGTFKERELVTVQILGVPRNIMDSTTNTIRDISLSLGVEHSFDIDSIFNTQTNFSFIPQIMLNAGGEKFTTVHTNKILNNIAKKSKRLKSFVNQSGSESFKIQSLSLALDFNFAIKKFIISPNVFFDYNLQNSTDQKLATVFSLTLGYSF